MLHWVFQRYIFFGTDNKADTIRQNFLAVRDFAF